MSTSVLHEIARRAGVSVSTVTRVLSGESSYLRPYYAERAERIRAIAGELQYRPSVAARAMSTGRFNTMCLIAGGEVGVGHLPPQLIDAVADAASKASQLLLVARLAATELGDPQKLPPILRRRAVDGVLVNYTHAVPPAVEQVIDSLGVPGVWLNNRRSHNAVLFADREAAAHAVAVFVSRGHRRILFYAPGFDPRVPSGHYSGHERWEGYCQGMRAAGLEPQIAHPADGDADYHVRVLRTVLSGPDRPTAVLALSLGELVVYGAQRLGLLVPEQVAVCIFSRYRDREHALPVAKLRVPDWELGGRGVAMLLRRIQDPTRSLPSERLAVPLVDDHWLPPVAG